MSDVVPLSWIIFLLALISILGWLFASMNQKSRCSILKTPERRNDPHSEQAADERRKSKENVSTDEARFREAQAANDPKSRSNKLRSEANALYQSLDGLDPCFLTTKISQVEGLYSNALQTASTPLEKCYASKNLAALARRKLRLTRADGTTALQLQVTALKHYVSALIWGSQCQTIAWMDDVYSAASELIDTVLDWRISDLVRESPLLAQGWPEDQGVVLGRLHAVLPVDSSSWGRSGHVASLQASLSLRYAKHLLREALDVQERGSTEQEWRRALDLVGRVQPLLQMAAHSAIRAGIPGLQEEAEELLDSAKICAAICRSTQSRHTGDALLKHMDMEGLDMEGLRLVADFYREAISHTRDLDLEARAHRSLGHLYYNMGVAMMPRQVEHTDWYREARAALLKAQREAEAAEEKAKATARASLKKELAEELRELKKAADEGAHVLVRHVYEKHPPPGLSPDFTVTNEMVKGDRIKNTLRKATIAYHPDKQVGMPDKWCILSEEISKELNCKYQDMK
ncbi:hypothetical protein PLESTB_000330300 [Pleodorina starrii]|uniref:J domain-containing protein n=1 Tax=Pleodorina starrii TaxID=330485 RepID=A0A9W6BD67_9CHLO|nr:hypothetical protein PLESTB_000330300 [Pleodorina starrii]